MKTTPRWLNSTWPLIVLLCFCFAIPNLTGVPVIADNQPTRPPISRRVLENYPKLAYLYCAGLAWRSPTDPHYAENMDYLAKMDLLIGGHAMPEFDETPAAVKRSINNIAYLRRNNPYLKVMAYITTLEIPYSEGPQTWWDCFKRYSQWPTQKYLMRTKSGRLATFWGRKDYAMLDLTKRANADYLYKEFERVLPYVQKGFSTASFLTASTKALPGNSFMIGTSLIQNRRWNWLISATTMQWKDWPTGTGRKTSGTC